MDNVNESEIKRHVDFDYAIGDKEMIINDGVNCSTKDVYDWCFLHNWTYK